MPSRPAHLTPEQRERLRAVWQTMLGYYPRIRYARSTQRGLYRYIALILSNPSGTIGYRRAQSDRVWCTTATEAAAYLVVGGVLSNSAAPLPYEQRRQLLRIIRQYIRDGHMTKKELVEVARIPNNRGLAIYFAQLV